MTGRGEAKVTRWGIGSERIFVCCVFCSREFGLAILSVWAVCTITFFIAYLAPGDPAQLAAGQHSDPQVLAQVRHEFGLDQPPLVRYGHYLGAYCMAIWVSRLSTREPITGLSQTDGSDNGLAGNCRDLPCPDCRYWDWAIGRDAPELDFGSAYNVIVLVRRDDAALCISTCACLGCRAKIGLAAGRRVGRSSRYYSAGHCLSRAACRVNRANDARFDAGDANQDYIRTARAKGLAPSTILFKHTTQKCVSSRSDDSRRVVWVFAFGSFVVETIFTVPGVGYESINSIATRDYSLIQGTTLLLATIFVTVNLIVDLLYAKLDPRVGLIEPREGA